MANSQMQIRKARPFDRFSGSRRILISFSLKNRDQLCDIIRNDQGTRFIKPLRGTPAYREHATTDFNAMLRQLGHPIFLEHSAVLK